MKASDYIVEFLINKGITDVFGYPGGMVTCLMESFSNYSDRILSHVTYHEQGAAFAACGYSQASGKAGVAYATSGPGATNLITGIGDAFFDSIPVIFITGQVNNNEAKGELGLRQRGFQETDIISIVKPITKYAVYVDNADVLQDELEKAYNIAMEGRKGPVLLDIPMNVFKSEISLRKIDHKANKRIVENNVLDILKSHLQESKRPVIILGAGIKQAGVEKKVKELLEQLNIPVVSSMISFDVMKSSPIYYGFIGAYGSRTANFIVAKSDLIISIGTRLDIRQVGANRAEFAPDAKIIRFDIDSGEFDYPVHSDEVQIRIDVEGVISNFELIDLPTKYELWLSICDEIQKKLSNYDDNKILASLRKFSNCIPGDAVITTDVGQNQVWVAQAFNVRFNQRVLFSGGHGAMGYSLPAAIGAYYGSGKKTIYCITGDGGMQMNIQELQFIAREKIPIKILVLNNDALGMIRHFQEMYFNGNYYQTKPEGGYSAPNFTKIAQAYGISSVRVEIDDLDKIEISSKPELIEVVIREDTYVFPKLEFGKPNQDQEPLIDRKLYEYLMNL